ncbi:hypothetical protein P9705_001252 [Enterococcus faecalis]|nr:hypothetical protein [Enterococcus faecalis]
MTQEISSKDMKVNKDLVHWTLFDSGLKIAEIARELNKPDSSVRGWFNRKTKIENMSLKDTADLTRIAIEKKGISLKSIDYDVKSSLIEWLIKESGISQWIISEGSNLPRTTIHRLSTGERSVEKLTLRSAEQLSKYAANQLNKRKDLLEQ